MGYRVFLDSPWPHSKQTTSFFQKQAVKKGGISPQVGLWRGLLIDSLPADTNSLS